MLIPKKQKSEIKFLHFLRELFFYEPKNTEFHTDNKTVTTDKQKIFHFSLKMHILQKKKKKSQLLSKANQSSVYNQDCEERIFQRRC